MSQLEILSAVHGIAPRSDNLLRLGVDLEKGRVSQAVFDEQIAQETEGWLGLQAEAGIDLQENGKLRWQDHLRPIVKVSDGFAPDIDEGPITRWFDYNRFYRQPTILGRLTLNHEKFDEYFSDTGEYISLLEPSIFAKLCANQSEVPARLAVLGLYDDLTSSLKKRGVQRIAYVNPETRTIKTEQPNDRFEKWIDVIDADTTAREQLDGRALSLWLTAPEYGKLILTHDVDLEYLPLSFAQDKVKRLGEFTASIREKWEAR